MRVVSAQRYQFRFIHEMGVLGRGVESLEQATRANMENVQLDALL